MSEGMITKTDDHLNIEVIEVWISVQHIITYRFEKIDTNTFSSINDK